MPYNDAVLPPKEALVAIKRDERYQGGFPFFFKPEWFPELKPLLDNWMAIRDEILAFEKQTGEIKGLDSNPYVAPQFDGINWSNIFLENFMIRHHKNRKKFPFTSSIVDHIPNCTFVVISVLSPHTVIKPHYGDTNGIVRGHLGLIIPAELPDCGIRVGDDEQGWTEGGLVMFTEAYLHGAWNKTDKKRYILVVDIVPDFMEKTKLQVCTTHLGAQSFNYLEKRFPIFKKLPNWGMNFFCRILSAGWYLYLPIQRRLRFL